MAMIAIIIICELNHQDVCWRAQRPIAGCYIVGHRTSNVKENIIMATAINSSSLRWLETAIAAPLHGIVGWYRVSQERAELRKMPTDRLTDVGLTQRQVEWETARPFWQAKRDD